MYYIPETVNLKNIGDLGLDKDTFLELQVKYKQLFEKLIISKLDFSSILTKLEKYNYPIVKDKEYNFYRKYSTLDNDYIYFRNNIHIENLTMDEVNTLSNSEVGLDFLKDTYEKVLFEDTDYVYLGEASDLTRIDGKSIMLEMAVDFVEIDDFEASMDIDDIVDDFKDICTHVYSEDVSLELGVSMQNVEGSYYPAIPDYFKDMSIELGIIKK